jgi:putative salt-induced outer membrane protein YdiY
VKCRTGYKGHLFWLWWLLWAALGCPHCPAEEIILHLRNGDRITGRLLSESTNSVAISTGFSTNMVVPKELIDRREALPKPKITEPPASTNSPSATPAKGPLVPATGVVSELTPTNAPAAAKKPTATAFHKFLSEWHGEIQLGANLGFSSIDREAFTGHLKLTENHKFTSNDTALRNILEYDAAYGTSGGVLSDNRMEGSVKTEYDLTKRFLIYNSATAGYDQIRGIDLQYDFGPGVGYKWVVLSNFVFKTEIGGDYQEQYFPQNKHSERYALRLEEDLWWQITPKIRWDEKVEFFPELSLSEYRSRLETNLSYLLKQNLTLSLNLIDQYDTGVPAGVSKNDLQIRSLVGVKF